jgi:hypothetical protein
MKEGEMGRTCSTHGYIKNAYFFVKWPEGKSLQGCTRCRWGDNIKMDLREIVCDGIDWIKLARDGIQLRPFITTVYIKTGNVLITWASINFFKERTCVCVIWIELARDGMVPVMNISRSITGIC